jgi:hypothetical protein
VRWTAPGRGFAAASERGGLGGVFRDPPEGTSGFPALRWKASETHHPVGFSPTRDTQLAVRWAAPGRGFAAASERGASGGSSETPPKYHMPMKSLAWSITASVMVP